MLATMCVGTCAFLQCGYNPNVPTHRNAHPSTSQNRNNSRKTVVRKKTKSRVPVKPDNVKQADYSKDNIVLPPYSFSGERKYTTWYQNGNMNLGLLDEACDYNSNITKSFANKIASRSPGSYSIKQVCQIFSYLYNHWGYVSDPDGQEYAAKASESIYCASGDCDDYAILMCSCILAIGGNADVVIASGPDGCHAYSEVDVSQMSEAAITSTVKNFFHDAEEVPSLHIRTDYKGRRWLNLDWQVNYPGGPYFNATNRDYYYFNSGSWIWKQE